MVRVNAGVAAGAAGNNAVVGGGDSVAVVVVVDDNVAVAVADTGDDNVDGDSCCFDCSYSNNVNADPGDIRHLLHQHRRDHPY